MKHLVIGDDRMPALGFGTFELQGIDCRYAVREALEVGYRHLDTARMYGNEGDVGGAIREAGVDRSDIFLTTKIWYDDLTPQAVRSELDRSLLELDTDYVDLLLIHWPNPDLPLQPTLEVMSRLRDEGRVRNIGVSNFTPTLVRQALEYAAVKCNQVEYHPLLDQRRLLDVVRSNDMVLVAYSPLGQGAVLREASVREIARRLGRDPAQVVLRWHVQQDAVAAIPRSSNPDHIRSNFEVFDFELDDDDMRTVSGLARGERIIDPSWAPAWER
jgi:2,5-diketo-D-gluconate reductase B